MNWDKFNQLRKVFEKHQIYPLLGVVPNNLDEKLNIGAILSKRCEGTISSTYRGIIEEYRPTEIP